MFYYDKIFIAGDFTLRLLKNIYKKKNVLRENILFLLRLG